VGEDDFLSRLAALDLNASLRRIESPRVSEGAIELAIQAPCASFRERKDLFSLSHTALP
jgi:hypothetical protein